MISITLTGGWPYRYFQLSVVVKITVFELAMVVSAGLQFENTFIVFFLLNVWGLLSLSATKVHKNRSTIKGLNNCHFCKQEFFKYWPTVHDANYPTKFVRQDGTYPVSVDLTITYLTGKLS